MADGFRIETGAQGDARSIRVLGDFDLAACQEISDRFHEILAERPEQVSLDLTGVAFIDSIGLATVIGFEREAARKGVGLRVVPPDEHLTTLLSPSSSMLRRLAGPEATSVAALSIGDEGFLEQIELTLTADPAAPARGRSEVREAADGCLNQERSSVAVLLTSEVVTNAVRHAQGGGDQINLRITVWSDRLRVETKDPGEGFDPLSPPPADDREGGRGLYVIDQLASRWGTNTLADPAGFEVWFEVDA